MFIEPITGFSFLVSVFEKIAQSLGKIRGTPKQRFARDVIALVDILSKLESSFTELESALLKLKKKTKATLKTEDFYGINHLYGTLMVECQLLIQWIRQHEKWLVTVDILAPDIKELLSEVHQTDTVLSSEQKKAFIEEAKKEKKLYELDFWVAVRNIEFNKSKQNKISTNELFLVKKNAEKPLLFIEDALTQIRNVKNTIRIFMVKYFTVDDLF